MSQITVEKTAEDSASKSLRVTVPVDRVREAEAKALKYYVQRARLPGFRPGKAPAAVVRKRFGDAIRQSRARGGAPRKLGNRQVATNRSSRSPTPRSGISSSRTAARSSSTCWSRCGPSSSSSAPAASESSAGSPPVADSRGRGAARAGAGAEGGVDSGRGRQAVARARWCGSRWRPDRGPAAPAPPSRTTSCSARTRRSPTWRSGS